MKVRLSTSLPRSIDQGIIIIGRFACEPRYSGLAISFRQFSRSSIIPCEQVGEHHRGAGCCPTFGDSGGIRTGATDGGSELGALVAHLQENSASIGNLGFFMSMGPRLLLLLQPSECMCGLAGGLGKGVIKGCGGYKSP